MNKNFSSIGRFNPLCNRCLLSWKVIPFFLLTASFALHGMKYVPKMSQDHPYLIDKSEFEGGKKESRAFCVLLALVLEGEDLVSFYVSPDDLEPVVERFRDVTCRIIEATVCSKKIMNTDGSVQIVRGIQVRKDRRGSEVLGYVPEMPVVIGNRLTTIFIHSDNLESKKKFEEMVASDKNLYRSKVKVADREGKIKEQFVIELCESDESPRETHVDGRGLFKKYGVEDFPPDPWKDYSAVSIERFPQAQKFEVSVFSLLLKLPGYKAPIEIYVSDKLKDYFYKKFKIFDFLHSKVDIVVGVVPKDGGGLSGVSAACCGTNEGACAFYTPARYIFINGKPRRVYVYCKDPDAMRAFNKQVISDEYFFGPFCGSGRLNNLFHWKGNGEGKPKDCVRIELFKSEGSGAVKRISMD